jgi:hypothetical protein
MKLNMKLFFIVTSILFALFFTGQLGASTLWTQVSAKTQPVENKQLRVLAKNAGYVKLDIANMKLLFADKNIDRTLQIPLPNGQIVNFSLRPSSIMSEAMTAKYPQMMTYRAVQIGQTENIGRFSISSKGFHGMFLQQGRWVLLSPRFENDVSNYISYFYQDALPLTSSPTEMDEVKYLQTPALQAKLAAKVEPTGDEIRTYRLAVSTTAEYTQAQGGTKVEAVAEIMNLVNRINQILLIDLAVQFELVDNEDIIFTNAASDPFTNTDAAADLETNQQVIDDALGRANYDLGHLLSTNGGGLAFVGAVCNNSIKAQGYTGDVARNASGERFYIDLVAHELGHQLGASHSFNASNEGACTEDQRSLTTSFEPGSGSTIMSYAGICDSQDLQNFSDPYFHAGSTEEIRDYVTSFTGRSCGTVNPTGNSIPQIQLEQNEYTIPVNTPFVLVASANDADGDDLNYSWEQLDSGGVAGATETAAELNADNGSNPLFRSISPSLEAQRYFPQLANVLADNTSFGETYPSTERELSFRLTVRDNNSGVNTFDTVVKVIANNNSFSVTIPDNSSNWQGNSQQLVSWDVADTHLSPVNCANVNISLDTDGTLNFSHELASETANDGEHTVIVPNVVSDAARLKIQCSDNIFYAVNASDFSLRLADPIAPSITGQEVITLPEDGQYTVELNDLVVSDVDSPFPDGFTLSLQTGNNYSLDAQTVIPVSDFNGQLTVGAVVNDGALNSEVFQLVLEVSPVNDAPEANNDSASVIQNSGGTNIDVLANDTDIEGDDLSLTEFSYTGTGQVSISNNQISYTPATGFAGSETVLYTVSDGQLGGEASLTIVVSAATPQTPTNSNSNGGGSVGWLLCYLATLLLARFNYISIRYKNV